MSILYVNEDDSFKKINIDDLYENKQKRDLKQISIFNKILNRIQHKITLTGKSNKTTRHIWFNIPEYIFGEPIYDSSECIAYTINKLEENGFFIKYMHPNTLFISWENWIPSYVRNELRKRKGIIVDEKGNIKQNEVNENVVNKKTTIEENLKKESKQYTPIGNYKPTGNLIYNQEVLDKLEQIL
jgi:hypothetical protein